MNNSEILKGLYQAFAKGDVPAVLAGFAPDINWVEAEGFMYGGNYVGADAIVQNIFMKFGTEWEGFSVVPEQFIDGGDNVVALGNYSGKFLRTGKSMKAPFAHVWTFENGKVTKFVQYTDTLKMARDLGL